MTSLIRESSRSLGHFELFEITLTEAEWVQLLIALAECHSLKSVSWSSCREPEDDILDTADKLQSGLQELQSVLPSFREIDIIS